MLREIANRIIRYLRKHEQEVVVEQAKYVFPREAIEAARRIEKAKPHYFPEAAVRAAKDLSDCV